MAELCENPGLKADIMGELETVAERARLQRFEKARQRFFFGLCVFSFV